MDESPLSLILDVRRATRQGIAAIEARQHRRLAEIISFGWTPELRTERRNQRVQRCAIFDTDTALRMRRADMQRLLFALLALSLSWTTIGYACGEEPGIYRTACCCERGTLHSCPMPSSACPDASIAGATGEGCCAAIATSGMSSMGEAEAPVTPAALIEPRMECLHTPRRPDRSFGAHPLTHYVTTKSVYLMTGRLRR
jgi:hypothetical protein